MNNFAFSNIQYDMEILIDTYRNRLEQANDDFIRYLMPRINWDNRLFAIVGARGTGKTTMLFLCKS